MTPQEINRRDVNYPFLAAAALGFAVWAASPWLVDRREPWDAAWPFYSASLTLGSAAIAWWQPNRAGSTWGGAWFGQVCALAVLPAHADGWLPLGAVTTGVGSLFALVGAVLGTRLRRLARG